MKLETASPLVKGKVEAVETPEFGLYASIGAVGVVVTLEAPIVLSLKYVLFLSKIVELENSLFPPWDAVFLTFCTFSNNTLICF